MNPKSPLIEKDIWLCIAVVEQGTDIDTHWIYWERPTGKLQHQQQLWRKDSGMMWDTAVYMLDSKPMEDFCPHCKVKLEWAACAERCPSCWWVKGNG